MNDRPPLQAVAVPIVMLEGASLAVLGDQVAVVVAPEDIYERKNIGVVEVLEERDLVAEEKRAGCLHVFGPDHLDGVVPAFCLSPSVFSPEVFLFFPLDSSVNFSLVPFPYKLS